MPNPAVTFRITPQDRGRLDELMQKTGKSLGQLLRETLGIAERTEEAAYDHGWKDGHEAGMVDGKVEGLKAAYGRVRLPCKRCGGTFEVNFYDHREAAGVLLDAFSDWVHKAPCPD